MTYSAHDVAAALRTRRLGLGALKLQKLLYYCQGHHLAVFGEPLFHETISAWDRGPVVGELWFAERSPGFASDAKPLDESALNTVGFVLSRYGNLSGSELERLTHTESPWQRADASRRPGESVPIDRSWMLEYFRGADGSGSDDREVALDSRAVADWLAGATPPVRSDHVVDSLDEVRTRLSSA